MTLHGRYRISEERTRKEMIDPQLEQAGWYLRDHSKVKIEIPVDSYDAEPWNEVNEITARVIYIDLELTSE